MDRLKEFVRKHYAIFNVATTFIILVIIVGSIVLLPFVIDCLLCTYAKICLDVKTVVRAWLLWLPIAVLICVKIFDRIVD